MLLGVIFLVTWIGDTSDPSVESHLLGFGFTTASLGLGLGLMIPGRGRILLRLAALVWGAAAVSMPVVAALSSGGSGSGRSVVGDAAGMLGIVFGVGIPCLWFAFRGGRTTLPRE